MANTITVERALPGEQVPGTKVTLRLDLPAGTDWEGTSELATRIVQAADGVIAAEALGGEEGAFGIVLQPGINQLAALTEILLQLEFQLPDLLQRGVKLLPTEI